MRWLGIALAVSIASVPLSAAVALDLQRGQQNYLAVMSGQKQLNSLSAEERQEVLLVYQLLNRRREAPANASDDCRSAMDRARSARSDLADYAKRVERCAEDSDSSNDCETEARRVRGGQDDLASALSEIRSNCE